MISDSPSLILPADSIIINQLMTQTCKGTTLTDFEPLEKIGEGSFSSVYKVRRIADRQVYAVKKVRLAHLSQKDIKNALNEARILASIQSPFVVRYKEAFYDEGTNALCIVMEYADGGDLQKVITKQAQLSDTSISEEEVWKAAAQVLSGLELLHSKGILHRDLKTANIFISGGVYKIGDMNVSKVQTEQQLAYTQTGTPYYASPEIWRDQPYDAHSDMWSFGCILYQMCTLHPPFQGKDIEVLYKRIKKGKYPKLPDRYSSELSNFIDKCLSQDARQRPTASELINDRASIILKKCRQYSITLDRSSSLKLLQTLRFKRDLEGFGAELPQPSYQSARLLKNKTEDTMEKSCSDNLSPKADEQKSSRSHKKLKIFGLKRYQEKQLKLQKFVKGQKDKQCISSDLRRVDKNKSMKSLIEKMQLPRVAGNNRSHRQIEPLIDVPSAYPRYARARHLTTQRKREPTEGQYESQQLDVIKEIRRRLTSQKNKVKKGNGIPGQLSIKAINSARKPQSANGLREQQCTKAKKPQAENLLKVAKKLTNRGKKVVSNPQLKRVDYLTQQLQKNNINAIMEQDHTKRTSNLKKKAKKHVIPINH